MTRSMTTTGRFLLALFAALLFLLALSLLPAEAAAQCPMCRTALDSPEGRQLAGAFNRAILFLLAIPFAAVGSVVLLVLRHRERE